jgi:hypothetical protein
VPTLQRCEAIKITIQTFVVKTNLLRNLAKSTGPVVERLWMAWPSKV